MPLFTFCKRAGNQWFPLTAGGGNTHSPHLRRHTLMRAGRGARFALLFRSIFWLAMSLPGALTPVNAAEKLPMITVHAKNHAYHNALVTVALPPDPDGKSYQHVTLTADKGRPVPMQLSGQDGSYSLVFILDDLPQGASRVYKLVASRSDRLLLVEAGIEVAKRGEDLEIKEASRLFTRYTTRSGPNKPFFYPILTPDGQPMTRRWPMEENTSDSHEHPHHRGLWFTHGDINGVDFWSEQTTEKVKPGKTIVTGFENLTSGPIFGAFRSHTDWRTAEDKRIATDVRDIRVYRLGSTRILDFDITLKPDGGSLTFGDTKEGMFGLRLPDSLAPNPDKSAHIAVPTGHIESASGLKDGKVWGKPNEWVDDYGPIGGKTWGVAIFDHPQNLRHPQTWHARDYGLFTVNPFGLHDFGLGEKGAGSYTLPADKTLTLRYRVVFHEGDTTAARIAEQYQNYADPPEITVK